jgi:tetratricopeptide (TPR) repeat protein
MLDWRPRIGAALTFALLLGASPRAHAQAPTDAADPAPARTARPTPASDAPGARAAAAPRDAARSGAADPANPANPADPADPADRSAAADDELKLKGKGKGKGKAERVKVELPEQTRTYEEQTPKAQRERARKLFKAGNKAFEQRQVDRAFKLYKQSYAIWPHPRVLFNMAVSLGFLGRPLASARTFKKVLEYGPEPITDLRYKQAAERYLELMGQLANIVVTCNDAGAKLYVNGEPIGTAPLDEKITVGPGTHMITANLEGKVPYSAQVRLAPGQLKRVRVSLKAFSDVVQYKMVDRYHWWVPTVVSGAAAVLAATGAGMVVQGRNDISTLEDRVDGWSPKTSTHPFASAERDSGVNFQKGGYALIGVSGAAAATAVLLWILRKKRVKYTAGSSGGGGVKVEF